MTNEETKIQKQLFEQQEKITRLQADLLNAKQDVAEKEKFDKSKKNPNFCQWYDKTGLEIAKLNLKNPTAISIMHFLTVNMTRKNAVVCSVKALEDFLGVKKTCVYNAIKFLKDNKLVTVIHVSNINIFIFDKNYVWRSWGNARGLEINADVVVSEKELTAKVLKELGYDEIAKLNIVMPSQETKNTKNKLDLPEDILDNILVDDNTD